MLKADTVIDSAISLEAALHKLIPISEHMGMRVLEYSGTKLVLSAPLSNNINHQQSAFGGSLFSVSALAGWGILQLKLQELGISANTVIAGGEVGYQLPVFSDIHCECELPADYTQFVDKLKAKGKASITLSPTILLDGRSAMSFNGKYVVVQK